MRVGRLVTCLVDLVWPEAGMATARLLQREQESDAATPHRVNVTVSQAGQRLLEVVGAGS